jgi:NAD(P)-dependent dehydrogenase (short-subunit alcohol dehydrogenase family)
MKVLLIGSTGTIGKEVAKALAARHDVIAASRNHGLHRVDIADKESLAALFRAVGQVDAVVCAAGSAKFAPLGVLTDDDFRFSLGNKLMGQVNVARLAAEYVADGGSITLTSGVLAREPMPGGAAIGMVNAALEGFVRGAALELPRGIRINVVSPPWVEETLRALEMEGRGAPAATVARAYVESVEGKRTGQVIEVPLP